MGARYGDASARGTGASESTTAVAQEVLAGSSAKRGLARVLPFLGPAFVAAVAYVDPGNFATNIAGGAQFGYLLLWVIVASNLMAMLIQALSAKLGIATGRNLAEVIRDEFPKPLVYLMWVVGEVVAIATDLAEFLGAAVGFNLLLGIPLLWAGLLTGFITFLILGLQRYGYRPLEIVITLMVGIIAGSYVIETFLGRPDWGQIAYHAAVPQFQGTESVLLATGILGATVMPHVIFLHSALTQNRIVVRDIEKAKRLFRYELIDVVVAMSLAGLVNAAMLITAAAAFHQRGVGDVGTLEQAHEALAPLLGPISPVVFAIALLASGLSSSTVGTMSGQVIMQGFLHRTIPIWLRRGFTMLPALAVVGLGFDPTRTLVLSQVVLSFGIPFALVPLVLFTRRRDIMGGLVNSPLTTVVVSLVAALILSLNIFLIYQTASGGGA